MDTLEDDWSVNGHEDEEELVPVATSTPTNNPQLVQHASEVESLDRESTTDEPEQADTDQVCQ